MSSALLSNRRNTREYLLMFFYSKEFMEPKIAVNDREIRDFLDDVTDIKTEDKAENIRDSIREVFDDVKITKLENTDVIEFQVPYLKDKVVMTFGDMDSENVSDGFFGKANSLFEKSGEKNEELSENDQDSPESFNFFKSYIEYYFTNQNIIDTEIKNNLENWDFGRISIVDKIILRMGIVELMYFPDIPPKVTINEAIELGKKYSTEKSNIFINGILNKLKEEIREKKK
jgi:transcription antitermination factor NusB